MRDSLAPRTLSLSAAAKQPGIRRHRLAQAVRKGELHAYRLGDRWIRLNWPEVVAWIKSHRISPKSHNATRAVAVLEEDDRRPSG